MANGQPSLREIIAAGPAVTEEDQTRYLGVPQGYTAERFGPEGVPPTMVAPRFSEADLYRPEAMGPEEKARIQQAMDRAGLFNRSDKYRLGVWDETTIDAYTRLLAFANRGGYQTETEALAAYGTLTPEEYDDLYGKGAHARSSGRALGGVSGPGTEADVPRGSLTQGMSGDDLKYLADRTARKSLGRKLTPDELNRFSGAYQSMLSAANQRQAAAEAQAQAGANVTYAGPTDPEAFATAQLEKLDPTAFAARKQLDAFKVIHEALGGLG